MFSVFQEVKVVCFPSSDPLNGKRGKVVGVAHDSQNNPPLFYIVIFDEYKEWPATVIIESCLEAV